MADFTIVTTTGRRLEANVGDPISSLADGELIAKVHHSVGHELTAEDREWMHNTIVPLLKMSGAQIGWT